MRKKIFFIIWALEVGGSERFLVGLIKNIPIEKFDIKVVCINRKGVWADEIESYGVPVISMEKRTGFDFTILCRLTSLLIREKPHLVNTHLWTADLWGRLAAILAGVKHIIVTEQNVDIWKRWYHKAIDKVLFKRTEKVICVSDQVVNFYHQEMGVPRGRLVMIPNAIDLDLFDLSCEPDALKRELALPSDCFLFVCAARLNYQKAHRVLIRATGILKERGFKNFYVLLAGDGELRDELEGFVREEQLTDRIIFLGLRQDIPLIFTQCDAFVLSSDFEGLPLAILEAMAAGLPIVATDVGGNSQVVSEGESGFLVPAQQPEALAAAMQKVMVDEQRRIQMGEMGKAMVHQNFSIETIAAKTCDLFLSVLNNGKHYE